MRKRTFCDIFDKTLKCICKTSSSIMFNFSTIKICSSTNKITYYQRSHCQQWEPAYPFHTNHSLSKIQLKNTSMFDHVFKSSRFTLGSQQMFKLMSLRMDSGPTSLCPLNGGLVIDGLPEVWPYLNQMLSRLTNVTYVLQMHTILKTAPHSVIH